MKKLLPVVAISLLAAACSHDTQKDKLCRKWQEVFAEAPEIDMAAQKERDVLRNLTDKDTAMLRIYGTHSADSARMIGAAMLAKRKQMNDETIRATRIEFSKNGTVQIHSLKGIANVLWALDGDRLTLYKKGSPQKKEWKLTLLNDTAMHVIAISEGITTNVHFKPAE